MRTPLTIRGLNNLVTRQKFAAKRALRAEFGSELDAVCFREATLYPETMTVEIPYTVVVRRPGQQERHHRQLSISVGAA